MTELKLYTAAEVADLLRMNHQVIQRKLQAGEIPAYRIGREWRVERSQLMEWLERHSNRAQLTPEQRIVDTYFDADGRLTKIPEKRGKREVVMGWIASAFEPGRTYPEREVNELLRRYHDDVAWIRRELVSMKLLVRKAGIYKRTAVATSEASATRRRA